MASRRSCINVRSFAGWVGCILFAEVLGSVCFRSSMSTIERRFNLSSTTTALLSSSFQIGSMPVLLLVSYFGSRYHRPRSIAIGCILMCLGFMLVAVPQFVGDRYEFVDISSNDTSLAKGKQVSVCSKSTSNVSTLDCKKDDTTGSDQLYLFILIGMIICGIGSTPVQPLGISYIDDYSSKHNAALLIGIVTSIGLAAPAFGYILGAFTLKLWVDVGWVDTSEIQIAPVHPGWVGAWWIGILVGSAAIFLTGLPMWFFPKELLKEKEKQSSMSSKENKSLLPFERVAPTLKVETGNLLSAFKRLLTNPKYLLIVAVTTCEMFRVSGVSVFSIKYYEVVFGKSASTSSFLVGAINLPALVVGTIMGSYAIKRWKLDTPGVAKLSLFSLIGSLFVLIVIMFVGCETIATAGLTVSYPMSGTTPSSLINSCNANCNCDQSIYTPVCGPNDVTYVTPCHAGCLDFTTDARGRINKYTNCGCVDDVMSNQTVTVGRCLNSNCEDLIWVVVALKTLGSWFGGLHVTPLLVLLLRSLRKEDKAFGIGMAYFTYRLLGFIPGPIVFGHSIDKACLHWTKKSCGEHYYCSVFESIQYRFTFLGVMVLVEMFAICFCLLYYFKYARWESSKTDTTSLKSCDSKSEKQDPISTDKLLRSESHKSLKESMI